MDSRTKRSLTAAELDALVIGAVGAGVVSAEELPDGFANAVWRVALDDESQVVVKVGPPPDLPLLTYERDLLRTEAMVYHLAQGTGLPLADLLHAGFDDPQIGGDWLILSTLRGTPWNRAAPDPARDQALRREVGSHLATLHRIPGSGVFGYPYAGLTGATWREAFLKMVGAVLDDAVKWETRLPATILDLVGAFHRNAAALDDVHTPALVHFDVWPGNVFLNPDGTIEALIDHERAFWGDPLADFVTPTIFGDLSGDDPMLAGYQESGGRAGFTPTSRIRFAMYQAYLYLILLVEDGPRQYPEADYARIRNGATDGLLRALGVLTHG
ncbi:phosphotransferase family protein [Herbidospora cretacea]|uniref:phosphotransferase family protein n=1 Tax=Herbidospora cretacea TaxID=28444 RepID=UPI000774A8F5|nr:phosphotransferase [Herbidospora cretacea]